MATDKLTLKSYFQTGDIPTQPQFEQLIDVFRHIDEGYTITNVVTSPSGATTITLSDGRSVTIIPPPSDKYVPKTGGGFTGPVSMPELAIRSSVNSFPLLVSNNSAPDFGFYLKNLGTQPANAEAFRLGLKHAANEKNGYISFYRGGSTEGGFLGLSANGSERVRISNNGFVGIGTSNPQTTLHTLGREIRIETGHGYGELGPRNGSWFHFLTDRPNFYFNKGIQSNGNLGLFERQTYMRHNDGAIIENNQRVATIPYVDNFFISGTETSAKARDSDKLDGMNSSAFLKVADSANFVQWERGGDNAFLVVNRLGDQNVDFIRYNEKNNAYHFNADSSKTNTIANADVFVKDLYSTGGIFEGGTQLSAKYLGGK